MRPKIWNVVIPGRFSGTAQVETGRLETGRDRYASDRKRQMIACYAK
jgi:hypothetical protein